MVSLNLRGRRRSAVRNGRLLTLLPLNQEPSSFCCSQRKLLTLDRKITQEKTKRFCRFFFWIPIFQRVFLYLQLCISFALFGFVVVVFFLDVLFIFCTGTKKELACCLSASVCFAEALLTQQRLTVDSFTLKKAPLCCSSMRGEIIVQYR